jgi:hypothetical protein
LKQKRYSSSADNNNNNNNKLSQPSNKLKYAKVIKREKSFTSKKGSNESTLVNERNSSNEELAASIGFRNGVFPRLQGYQPQWISQQQQQQPQSSNNNFKRNQALFEQQQNYAQSTSDLHQHRGSSFRVNPSNENLNMYNSNSNLLNSPSKLKYSESARNNYSHKEMGRSVQDLNSRSPRNNIMEDYAIPTMVMMMQPQNEFMDENSEFILKPASASSSNYPNYKNQVLIQDPNYISNLNRGERMMGVFIPVKPTTMNANNTNNNNNNNNNNNKKSLNNYNPLKEYGQHYQNHPPQHQHQANYMSDPDMMRKNNNYVHHDVYY